MTARPKRPRPPASPRPWLAVVLGVDPGSKRSGWSLWAAGLYRRSSECRLSISALNEVVAGAHDLARDLDMPCVLVTERPFMQKQGKAHGASDHSSKLWRDVWVDCGGVKKRVVRVWPASWRSAVLGRGNGNKDRDAVRKVEKAAAMHLVTNYGYSPAPEGLVVGPDEAPAIAIGRWGTCAGEVGEALPKKLRRVA